jgi:hypothetical protein
MPVVGQMNPALHMVHAEAPATLLYIPTGHATQACVFPVSENVPVGHWLQDVAAEESEEQLVGGVAAHVDDPAGHTVQLVDWAALLKEPLGHAVHVEGDDRYVPIEQALHCPAPAGEIDPVAQAVHDDEPATE